MSATQLGPLPSVNRQFKLAARPVGLPKESDFSFTESPMPAPAEGQVLVKTVYLSVDPYMRGRITGIRTYADPVNIGEVIVGADVGQVIESQDPNLRPGDFVVGYWGWRDHVLASAAS